MCLKVCIVFTTAVVLVTCRNLPNAEDNEKLVTKRHLFEAFSENPKFRSVFSNENPEETLANKFLGENTDLAGQPRSFVTHYALSPLEEIAPIEYDYTYDYMDNSFQPIYDSSSSEEDSADYEDRIYAINPNLIFHIDSYSHIKYDNDDAVGDNTDENSENSNFSSTIEPIGPIKETLPNEDSFGSGSSEDVSTDKFLNTGVQLNKTQSNEYLVKETASELKPVNKTKENKPDIPKVTDVTTEYSKFAPTDNSGIQDELSTTGYNNGSDDIIQSNIFISNSLVVHEHNGNNTNVSNLLLNNNVFSEDPQTVENSKSSYNKTITNYVSTDSNNNKLEEDSVLYTSSIYGANSLDHIKDKSESQSHNHNIAPHSSRLDLTLEKLNNILDKLQEKTIHDSPKNNHGISKTKNNSAIFHHSKYPIFMGQENADRFFESRFDEDENNPPENVLNNNYLTNKNNDKFFENRFDENENSSPENVFNNRYLTYKNNEGNRNGDNTIGQFPAFRKWLSKAKKALANIVVNSFHSSGIQNPAIRKLSKHISDNILPKSFPKFERNMVVIPQKENSRLIPLPEDFPKNKAVVVPSNLQINDSPLGALKDKDVNTLRDFFNNDFEKRNVGRGTADIAFEKQN